MELYDAIARRMDISCVKSSHTQRDIDALVAATRRYPFAAAFALPCHTPYLVKHLKNSATKVGGTVGFPSGCTTTATKVFEAGALLDMGCDELDMVLNIGELRSGHTQFVQDDIAAVIQQARDKPVKAILEVTLLTDEEIVKGCEAAVRAGVAYVKTGTGWMPEPTTVAHIQLMRKAVGDRVQIKAAGGIRDLHTLLEMKAAGCDRFGIGLGHAVSILREAGAPD